MNVIYKTVFIMLIAISILSCNKTKEIDGLLVGSWRIKRAHLHTIYSFRNNGSWVAQTRVEGRFSKIVDTKKEVDGEWEVNVGESDEFNLSMIPGTDGEENEWISGKEVVFEIVSIDKKVLSLKNSEGVIINWSRVRGKQTEDETGGVGVVTVKPGPLIVNLKKARAHGKFRFLCIDLELSVQDIEENDYISFETIPETGLVNYHLHPKIREVSIYYLSSLTYKDIKSLDKVKQVIEKMKLVLNPYFNGRLQDINVKKVVVTASTDSVEDFERYYASLNAVETTEEGETDETE